MAVKLIRDSKLCYFNKTETTKNLKPFWNECKPYFCNVHAHGDSKVVIVKKENIINNSNEIIKKEALLIKNDEVAKTFNKNFAKTAETLNTFKWPSKNTDLLNDQLTAIIKNLQKSSN